MKSCWKLEISIQNDWIYCLSPSYIGWSSLKKIPTRYWIFQWHIGLSNLILDINSQDAPCSQNVSIHIMYTSSIMSNTILDSPICNWTVQSVIGLYSLQSYHMTNSARDSSFLFNMRMKNSLADNKLLCSALRTLFLWNLLDVFPRFPPCVISASW